MDFNVQVKKEIIKILKSKYFIRSKRVSHFFSVIMDKKLSGDVHLIKEYTLGREVFDMDVDFNPSLNPIIRVTAGNLRKRIKQYYLNEGKYDPIIIEIPQGTYIPNIKINEPSGKHISGEKKIPEKITLQIITPWSDDIQKANAFLHSLIFNINFFPNYDIYINKEQDDIHLHKSDFTIYVSLFNDSEDLIFIVNIMDSLNQKLVWTERFQFKDLQGSYIKWLDQKTKEIGNTIASEFGIIKKYIAFNKYSELNLYNNSLHPFRRIFYTSYQSDFLNKSFELNEEAINSFPYDVTVMSNLSSLYSIQSFLDNKTQNKYLSNSNELLNRIKSVDPQNPLVKMSTLRNYLAGDNFLELKQESRDILNTPNQNINTLIVASGSSILTDDDPEKMVDYFKSLIKLSPYYPKYTHIYLFLYYYARKNFEEALKELRLSPETDAGFYTIGLISLLGNLNRLEEAQILMNRVYSTNNDFEFDICRYYPPIVLRTGLYDLITNGLNKIL